MGNQYLDEGLAVSSLQKLAELMEMQKAQITRGGHSEDGEMEGEEVHEKDQIGKDGNYQPTSNLVHKSDGHAAPPSHTPNPILSGRNVTSGPARESRVKPPAGPHRPITDTQKLNRSQDEEDLDMEKGDKNFEDPIIGQNEDGKRKVGVGTPISKSDFGTSSFAGTGDRSGVPAYDSARSRAPSMSGRQAMKTETDLTRENRGRHMDPSSRTGSEKPAFNRSQDEGDLDIEKSDYEEYEEYYDEDGFEKADKTFSTSMPGLDQMHKPVRPRLSKPDNPRGMHGMERQLKPPATTKSIDVQRFLTYLAKSVTDALDDMRENVFIALNEMNKSRLEMGNAIIESLSDIDGVVQKSLGVVDEAEQQPARGPMGVTSDNEVLQKSQGPQRRLVHDVQMRKAIAEEMSSKIIAGTASYGLTDLTRFEHNPAAGLPEHIAKSLSCLQG